jgi:hypothetical protein
VVGVLPPTSASFLEARLYLPFSSNLEDREPAAALGSSPDDRPAPAAARRGGPIADRCPQRREGGGRSRAKMMADTGFRTLRCPSVPTTSRRSDPLLLVQAGALCLLASGRSTSPTCCYSRQQLRQERRSGRRRGARAARGERGHGGDHPAHPGRRAPGRGGGGRSARGRARSGSTAPGANTLSSRLALVAWPERSSWGSRSRTCRLVQPRGHPEALQAEPADGASRAAPAPAPRLPRGPDRLAFVFAGAASWASVSRTSWPSLPVSARRTS